jgi:hypothetical protein
VNFLPFGFRSRASVFLAIMLGFGQNQLSRMRKTDDEIKQAIIEESIASYGGYCPYPYSIHRAGHTCGARSAYNRLAEHCQFALQRT